MDLTTPHSDICFSETATSQRRWLCSTSSVATLSFDLAWVALAIAMIIFFGTRHTTERYFTAEHDLYAEQAQMIQNGIWPRDVFHPMGYSLLAAAIGKVTGDTFQAGKYISQGSAVFIVLLTWYIGRKNFQGHMPVLLALSALSLNFNFLIEGVAAATDMMFSALILVTIYFATLAMRDKASILFAFIAGLFAALAYFTRYIGIVVIPVCLAILIWIPGRGIAPRSLFRCAAFTFALFLGLLPHMAICMEVFGRPFYDENYRSLAMWLYGRGDWTYLLSTPFQSYSEIVKFWPGGYISGVWISMVHFANGAVASTLAPHWEFRLPGVFTLFLLASISQMRRGSAYIRACLVFFALYIFVICVTFFPQARYFLFLIPIGYLCIGDFIEKLVRRFFSPGPANIVLGAIVLTVLIGNLLTLATFLPAYQQSHYDKEFEALLCLDRELPENAHVAGTNPFAKRHVKFQYDYVPEAAGPGSRDSSVYFEGLQDYLKKTDAEYFFVGAATLGIRPRTLLYPSSAPSFLIPIAHSSDTAFYRVARDETRIAIGSETGR